MPIQGYEGFCRVRAQFNAPSHLAILNTQALMEPLAQANELALKAAENQCRAMLDRYRPGRVGRPRSESF